MLTDMLHNAIYHQADEHNLKNICLEFNEVYTMVQNCEEELISLDPWLENQKTWVLLMFIFASSY